MMPIGKNKIHRRGGVYRGGVTINTAVRWGSVGAGFIPALTPAAVIIPFPQGHIFLIWFVGLGRG